MIPHTFSEDIDAGGFLLVVTKTEKNKTQFKTPTLIVQ